jgi:hypothetical protein
LGNCHKAKEKGQKAKTIEPRAKIKDELIEARKPLPQAYHWLLTKLTWGVLLTFGS